jgi:hypothetical protein
MLMILAPQRIRRKTTATREMKGGKGGGRREGLFFFGVSKLKPT